jgi:hypothetical protein
METGFFYVVPAEELKKEDNWSNPVQLSVESQPVKRTLGSWCEMATTLGPS